MTDTERLAKLKRLYAESKQELSAIGIPCTMPINLTLSTSVRLLGECKIGTGIDTEISVNRKLLDMGTDHEIKGTIIHEMLHAKCPANTGHTGMWKVLAKKVTASTDYEVSRLSSDSKVNSYIRPSEVKTHLIACTNCGMHFYYKRLTSIPRNIKDKTPYVKGYRCPSCKMKGCFEYKGYRVW